MAGPVLYPFALAKETLALYRDFATSTPDEVNTVAALMHSPDGDPLAAIVVCYNGSPDAGEKVLRPIRSFGPPLADEVAQIPYRKVQTLLDDSLRSRPPLLFQIELYPEHQQRGDRRLSGALRVCTFAAINDIFPAVGERGESGWCDRDRVQPSRSIVRMGLRCGLA